MGYSVRNKHKASLNNLAGDGHGEIDARLMYCELAELAGGHANLREQIEEALRMAEKISYMAGIAKAKLTLGSIVFHAGEFQARIVQEPQPTENRAIKVANRPLLNPENGFQKR